MFKKFNQALWLAHLKYLKRGVLRGKDVLGNRYYQVGEDGVSPQRYVVYAGLIDASTVPADWHGWLHYTTDIYPGKSSALSKTDAKERDVKAFPSMFWQRGPLPNLTGTLFAYFPRPPLSNKHGPHWSNGPDLGYTPWQPYITLDEAVSSVEGSEDIT